MKAEHLTNWQPEATTEQLNEFIQQNSTLLTLLEEAWAKFAATLPEKTPVSQSNYGENVDWDTLEHFPISHEEMIEFLNHFEKERHHNDRPFGNNIHVNEYNCRLQSDDDSNQNES